MLPHEAFIGEYAVEVASCLPFVGMIRSFLSSGFPFEIADPCPIKEKREWESALEKKHAVKEAEVASSTS